MAAGGRHGTSESKHQGDASMLFVFVLSCTELDIATRPMRSQYIHSSTQQLQFHRQIGLW